MGNLFLASAFMAYCFLFFDFTSVYMSAYRAFYSLFGEVIEASVISYSESGETIPPYFDYGYMKEGIGFLLDERLKGRCDYDYRVYPANPITKLPEASSNQGALVELDCSYMFGETILSKKAFFAISEISDE